MPRYCIYSKFPAFDDWAKHIQGFHGGLWNSDGKCTIKCHPNTPTETKAVLSKKQIRVDQRSALATSWRAGIQAQWIDDETDEKDLFNDILVSQMKEHGFLKPDDTSVWTLSCGKTIILSFCLIALTTYKLLGIIDSTKRTYPIAKSIAQNPGSSIRT